MDYKPDECCICFGESDPDDPDYFLETERHRPPRAPASAADCTTFFHRACFRKVHGEKKLLQSTKCGSCQCKYSEGLYERCGVDKDRLNDLFKQYIMNFFKSIFWIVSVVDGLLEALDAVRMVVMAYTNTIWHRILMDCLVGIIGSTIFMVIIIVSLYELQCKKNFFVSQVQEHREVLTNNTTKYPTRHLLLGIFANLCYGCIVLFHLLFALSLVAGVWWPIARWLVVWLVEDGLFGTTEQRVAWAVRWPVPWSAFVALHYAAGKLLGNPLKYIF